MVYPIHLLDSLGVARYSQDFHGTCQNFQIPLTFLLKYHHCHSVEVPDIIFPANSQGEGLPSIYVPKCQ